MLETTLNHIRCIECKSKLKSKSTKEIKLNGTIEIISGELLCLKCTKKYPIISGVAILVQDSDSYILSHIKGIAEIAQDDEIPKSIRKEYISEKKQIETEHIEEDLESKRVNSLYLLNHYFKTSDNSWWKNTPPEISELIKKYWDKNLFSYVNQCISKKEIKVIDLGCNVGGLLHNLEFLPQFYLGIDYSFASIAIARHLNLNTNYPHDFYIPQDLIDGLLNLKLNIKTKTHKTNCDFVVCDFDYIPTETNYFDLCVAMNTIDMLENPELLPALQFELINKKGIAIQCCPYIWHENIAKKIRTYFKNKKMNSSDAVIKLYEDKSFTIQKEFKYLPWIFFKHLRQIEIYSVHMFSAIKRNP